MAARGCNIETRAIIAPADLNKFVRFINLSWVQRENGLARGARAHGRGANMMAERADESARGSPFLFRLDDRMR
jgi:hypothetical protein